MYKEKKYYSTMTKHFLMKVKVFCLFCGTHLPSAPVVYSTSTLISELLCFPGLLLKMLYSVAALQCGLLKLLSVEYLQFLQF